MDLEKMTARELAAAGESGTVKLNALKVAAKRHLGDETPSKTAEIIKALRALDASAGTATTTQGVAGQGGGQVDLEEKIAAVKARNAPTLAFPLPADLPERAFEGALLVVKSKPAIGRRRAGYAFTPEEIELPWAELEPAVRDAIVADPQLDCALRLMD